ncbi:MAG: AAA family ATPase, partial [Anaerolineales bacterium]|nr:AAA family ATPase [Anaerolineales bacterium]
MITNGNLVPDFIQTQFQKGQLSGSFQGVALFVDIAGFTPLTETLAQFHRDGAEALTLILTETLSPHIREAYRRGGIIPLFAGDSFIAIFPGESPDNPKITLLNAARQAIQTAFAMQRFFQSKGSITTPYGAFDVGIKIGLAIGDVQWGIPGNDIQRAFYFRGSAIDRCAKAQEQAAIGEIIADTSFTVGLEYCTTAVSDARPDNIQLLECHDTIEPIRDFVSTQETKAYQPFIPEPILHMTAHAEFREVAPVFISFEAPDDVEEFHVFVSSVITLANKYGGYFSQIEFGDKGGVFVILFGAPVAYENQVERAAEFLHSMKRHNFTERWRAGMTFGIVWAGIRGSAERCEYGTVGDMVNLSARLAMKADWGKIWVNESANTRLKQKYWLGALGQFSLKGKQKTVPIYQLLYKKEASQDAFYQGDFIGRESELENLYACTSPIFNGRFGGIIYVHGETGMGKSRLVHEFRRRLIGKHYPITLYCPAEEIIRTSLNPFKSLLRAYFRQSAEKTRSENLDSFNNVFDYFIQQIPGSHTQGAEIKQELIRTQSILAAMIDIYWPDSLYERLEPKLRFENTLAALKNFVKAAALTRPVILHIENAHWLDTDSRQMLTWLTRNVAEYPFIIICVNRYQDDGTIIEFEVDPDVQQHRIELERVNKSSIQQMAAQILKKPIDPQAVTFLANKSDGNPFFLEQLVLDLYEQGIFVEEDGRYHLQTVNEEDIPSNINTLLLSRLDRLETEVKHVVNTATVLGQEFELRILSQMLSGDPQLTQKVQIAEKKQVWVEKDRLHYLFQSTLLRDAAYSMQLRGHLRQLHQKAAEGIEALFADDLAPYYSDLAYHYDKANKSNNAVIWYQKAGELAANRYA